MIIKRFSTFTRLRVFFFSIAIIAFVFLPAAIAVEPEKCWEFVIPCKFDDVGGFAEGLAMICQKGKYGFIDKTGKIVTGRVKWARCGRVKMGHSKSIFCHCKRTLIKDADNGKLRWSGNGKLNHYVEASRLVESSYSLAT